MTAWDEEVNGALWARKQQNIGHGTSFGSSVSWMALIGKKVSRVSNAGAHVRVRQSEYGE